MIDDYFYSYRHQVKVPIINKIHGEYRINIGYSHVIVGYYLERYLIAIMLEDTKLLEHHLGLLCGAVDNVIQTFIDEHQTIQVQVHRTNLNMEWPMVIFDERNSPILLPNLMSCEAMYDFSDFYWDLLYYKRIPDSIDAYCMTLDVQLPYSEKDMLRSKIMYLMGLTDDTDWLNTHFKNLKKRSGYRWRQDKAMWEKAFPNSICHRLDFKICWGVFILLLCCAFLLKWTLVLAGILWLYLWYKIYYG